MTVPKWVRVRMLATAVIPVALVVIGVLKFGALPLIFAILVGTPIFFLGRRRGRRIYERDEQRWAEWEARRHGNNPQR